ncbi:MAG: hypothetical protein E6X43_06085 [Peptostreptococcaceae bacterium]|nr:hypothetical protein [Peptostreptococcaceae bacterium]
MVELPSIIDNVEFKTLLNELLTQAHEATKLTLKDLRKNGSYIPTVKKSR